MLSLFVLVSRQCTRRAAGTRAARGQQRLEAAALAAGGGRSAAALRKRLLRAQISCPCARRRSGRRKGCEQLLPVGATPVGLWLALLACPARAQHPISSFEQPGHLQTTAPTTGLCWLLAGGKVRLQTRSSDQDQTGAAADRGLAPSCRQHPWQPSCGDCGACEAPSCLCVNLQCFDLDLQHPQPAPRHLCILLRVLASPPSSPSPWRHSHVVGGVLRAVTRWGYQVRCCPCSLLPPPRLPPLPPLPLPLPLPGMCCCSGCSLTMLCVEVTICR